MFLAENSAAKKIRSPKFSDRSITTLLLQLSNKQTDPTNLLVEIEHQT